MAKVKQLWRDMSPAEQANYGMSITKTIENNAQIVHDVDFDEPIENNSQIANDVDFDEPIENNAQIANDIDFDEPMYEPAPKVHRKEELLKESSRQTISTVSY